VLVADAAAAPPRRRPTPRRPTPSPEGAAAGLPRRRAAPEAPPEAAGAEARAGKRMRAAPRGGAAAGEGPDQVDPYQFDPAEARRILARMEAPDGDWAPGWIFRRTPWHRAARGVGPKDPASPSSSDTEECSKCGCLSRTPPANRRRRRRGGGEVGGGPA
ncbi:unnamed protein product, partial [Prorocentrum cordatum]